MSTVSRAGRRVVDTGMQASSSNAIVSTLPAALASKAVVGTASRPISAIATPSRASCVAGYMPAEVRSRPQQ